MKYLSSLVFVSLWIAVFGEGMYYPLLKGGRRATVQHIKSDHELSERSAENPSDVFKETMSFSVQMDDGTVIELVLKRNDRRTPHALVKVASDSGSEMINMDRPKDYRFYQVLGDNHGGAVMVKCPDFKEPCVIAGNFYYQGNEYIIDPDTGVASKAAGTSHTVHRVEPTGHSYGDDAVSIRVDSKGSDEPEKKSTEPEPELMSKLMNLLGKKGRPKRQTASARSFKIELEMVVCDDVFTFWYKRLGQNRDAAIQKIVEYYEQIANSMDLRFSTVTSSTMDVDIIPYLINIRETPSQCSWVTNNIVGNNTDGIEAYNANTALDVFGTWAKSNKNPNSDAIMSFSRRDMWFGGVVSGEFTTGLAISLSDSTGVISATCRTDYVAVSIVEEIWYGDTSATASHELAHNLGVKHDVATTNCLDTQQFIMAPSSTGVNSAADAKNPWTFSPCSIAAMETTLFKLPKDSNGLTCLERNTFDPAEYNRVLTSDLLGEIYPKDEQCSLHYGAGSIYCSGSWTGVTLEEICWKGLPCSTSLFSNGECASSRNIDTAAGTSCGATKQCYQGLCIENANIPPPDTEPVSSTTTTSTTTTTTPTTTTTTPTTTTTTPTTTTTTPTTTTTTPTTTTTTPTTTTTTPTTTTTTPTTTTTTPTTTTTTPTSTTTTPTTTTTTPTTTTTTPTTTTTSSPTTTTTTPTTTTTTPTTTTTTPTTTPTTTTTTPTTTTSTPTTTTTTPTTTTTTPTTTTTTSTTTTTTPTTTTTTPTTTTTRPTTTTTTTKTPTTTSGQQYTDAEIDFLWFVYNRCDVYCSCWRRQCRRYGQENLCRRFAPGCY